MLNGIILLFFRKSGLCDINVVAVLNFVSKKKVSCFIVGMAAVSWEERDAVSWDEFLKQEVLT